MLAFAKESIETNVSTGITTVESYIAELKQYLAATKKLMSQASQSLGSNNEHTQRLTKRTKIIQAEIIEMEGGA